MSDRDPVRLGEVISIKHGFAFPGEQFADDPKLPTLVTPGNFSIGGGFKHAKPKTFQGDFPEEYRLHPGDLLISMTDLSREGATLGLPAIVPSEGVYLHNQRVGLVRVEDPLRVNPKFLNFFFRTAKYRAHVLSTASGSTVRHTSPSRVCAFVADLPTLDEQLAIAEVLGALDDKIAANAHVAAVARELGAHLFLGSLDAQVTTPALKDLARHRAGKYLAKEAYSGGGAFAVFGSNSVMGTHTEFTCDAAFTVLARIGSSCGALRWSQRPAWVNNNASAIVPRDGINPWVLRHALQQVDMSPFRAGSGQPFIQIEPLMDAELRWPSRIREAQIGPVLRELAERECLADEESTTLATLRDVLLPQLMSGNLRVRDAERVLEEVV